MNRDWIELWLDRNDGARPEPLRVGYSPGTTVRELARALDNPGHHHEGHIALVGIEPPTGVLPADAPLERSGLRRGQVVTLAGPDRPPPKLAGTATTVLVRRGPDRGRREPLGASLVVGRAADCGLRLNDLATSRRHVRLTRRDALVEVETLGDAAVVVDGKPLRTSVPVEPGTPIRIGDSELVVVAPTRQVPAGASPVSHQRPPRPSWTPNPPVLDLPEPPRRTGVGTVPWLSIGLTAAFAMVMVMGGGFGGGISGNLIWFFTPLLLASGTLEYALSARRGYRRARKTWRADLIGCCVELGEALDDEARREAHAAPPPSEWELAAEVGSARLWERRREHPDALRLRLGLTHAHAAVSGELPTSGPNELLDEARDAVAHVRWRQDVVSTLDLAEVGSIGLHGPDAHHLASTLVAQLASAVGPEDVALAVVVQPNRAGQWRWVAALPHVRSAAELLDGPATAGAGGHHTLVAAVSALGAARQHNTTSPGDRPPSRVPLVLVLDGEVGGLIETRRLAELCRLGAVGIHVLWLERRPSHTPLGCSATVTTVRKGMATVVSVPGAEPKQVRWESLPDDRLERLAHHLAPRRDGDRAGTGAGLPAAVSLAALAIPAAIEGTLAASIGLGPDGPVTIDLRRDGPHVLVAGTTGAGKSELLRTLVAGLAMAHSPRRLNFVIVDFKGGTGIGPLAELPHVAGMITDLDVGEAQRLRLGLEAEVERRLRILAGAGLENLAALEVRDPAAAPPAIVLVIDEFAALARQAPAVLDGLIDLAQRGRSLGIHLVLATQRPRGVISEAIRANTNLRLVARMANEEESIDVLDDPAAAHLATGTPGRVLMRIGAAAPTPVQVAFTGTTVGRRPPVTVLPLTLDGPPSLSAAGPTTSPGAETEADAVVRSTLIAAGAGHAERLWLQPLPHKLSDPHRELGGRDDPGPVQGWPLALADLPRRRRRAVWSVNPGGAVLVVLGGGGSGRTSTLRALACTAASDGAAVVGIDGAGGHLAALDASVLRRPSQVGAFNAHTETDLGLGAMVAVRDVERLTRLIWWLEQGNPTPRLLLIDGWEGVWDRAEQAGGSGWLARLVEVIRTARSRRLTVAISANRPGALPPEVRAARTSLLALPGAEAEVDLGLSRPPPTDAPPGRGRLVTVAAHLLGGEADPNEGPMVQVRWVAPDRLRGDQSGNDPRHGAAGGAPLVSPLPPKLRLPSPGRPGTGWDSAPVDTDRSPGSARLGTIQGVMLGIDLERDHPVAAPAHGPFWVLGRARSGRSTVLTALAAGMPHASGMPGATGGSKVLIGHAHPNDPSALWNMVLAFPPDSSTPDPCDQAVSLVAVDDAHRLNDDGWATLARWLETLHSQGSKPLVALAADPVSLDRWNPVVTSLLGHGHGLILAPGPDEDGRLLGGELPRSRPFTMPAGRGYLISRGSQPWPVQVAWPRA